MEANDPARLETSELSSQNHVKSDGSTPRPPQRSARPIFKPKQPPRSRQRGALPPLPLQTEEQPPAPQQRGYSMPSLEQQSPPGPQCSSLMPSMEERALPLRQRDSLLPSMEQQTLLLRQRGSLMPSVGEQTLPLRQRGSLMPSMEEQTPVPWPRGSTMPPMEEQTLAPWQRGVSMQQVLAPRQRGALMPSMEEQNPAPQQRGSLMPSMEEQPLLVPRQRGLLHTPEKVQGFSKSWHRGGVQEQPRQRGTITPAQEQHYRPRQRGAISPSVQEQARDLQQGGGPRCSAADTPFSSHSQGPTQRQSEVQRHTVLKPFLETKIMFLEMAIKLEAAMQSHESMFFEKKKELEKSFSDVKAAKAAALKEREEVEASKAGAMEGLEAINRQVGEVKSVREGLEHINTDLSVQLAELNRLQQQLEEQQRILEVLASLKAHHHEAPGSGENEFMDKNLQECEVRLATLETELASSRLASEQLEQTALKRITDLNEVQVSAMVLLSDCRNLSSLQSKLQQANTDRSEMFNKTTRETRPLKRWLNGDECKPLQESSGYVMAMKQPKLEFSS